MALSNNFTSLSSALTKLPQQRIAQAVSVLLLVYVAFVAAKITWLVVPQKAIVSNVASPNFTTQQNKSGQSVKIFARQQLNFFVHYQTKKRKGLV